MLPLAERRVPVGAFTLPACFPLVPVVDHTGMPRMQMRLVDKHIEPASLLGTSKLVVLDPVDKPVEATVRLFLRVGAPCGGIPPQETDILC